MRNDDQVSKLDFQSKGVIGVHGMKPMKGSYLDARTPEEQHKIFRNAIAEQSQASAASAPSENARTAPAIHDDKIYRGYNPVLRTYVRGRTHEREILKQRGFRHAL